jgi:hypothetical protein
LGVSFSSGFNVPARLDQIEDPEVRKAIQNLWLFETQKAQSRNSTYKDHYRKVLEAGARDDAESTSE